MTRPCAVSASNRSAGAWSRAEPILKTLSITIRDEHPADTAAIRHVHVRAFGREREADLVDALRAHGAALLSLAALVDGRIVGHILYSPASVGEMRGAALAPLAVLPEYHRQGVGGQLVAAGTQRCRDAGCPFVIVLGHAAFYPRFGFVPATTRSIRCEWDMPDDAFMVLVLNETMMHGVSGIAKYREEFSTVT
jgi:putative acetyltransferase